MSNNTTGKNHAALEEVAADWSEYTTPEGKKYYYNKKTKISTWKRPDVFETAQGTSGSGEGL